MKLIPGLLLIVAAGFPLPVSAGTLAITFDDLPATFALPPGQTRVAVATDIIRALKAAGVRDAYGFVNGSRIEETNTAALNDVILPKWRAAGFSLGNHTWSHSPLSNESIASFETEISRVEPLLRSQMGENGDWRWVRFPFLDEGSTPQRRAAARHFLAAHHYRIASVTLSFADAAFNDPYARCLAKGDQQAVTELENRFMGAAASSLDNENQLAKSLFGRDISYVLLLHFGAFDAHMLPRLLKYYAARGVHFVTLRQAMRDPIYRQDLNPTRVSSGPVSLEAIAAERGVVPSPNIWAPYARYPGGALEPICR